VYRAAAMLGAHARRLDHTPPAVVRWHMLHRGRTALWFIPLLVSVAACAPRRPVLYPNEQMQRVGPQVAERDIDDCMRRADQYVSSGARGAQATRDVAGSTAIGAGTGAAIGAVGGAVTGNAGEGAAVGAATGGTAGLLGGIFGASSQPDPVYVNFVERCLRERGYDPIGWK
jgi:OmpA family protein